MKLASMILTMLILASAAFAAEPTVKLLIIKSSSTGYTAPEWAYSEQCAVFTDHVTITKTFGAGEGGFQVTESRTISISTGIQSTIFMAHGEAVEERENNLCDGPSSYIGFNRSDDTGHILFSTGGCGSPRLERTGPYSNMLRRLVDAYCPTTYDFNGRN